MFDLVKINVGLNLLIENDNYLLINDVSERAITHKLAEYYQNLFPKWNVDCEYNKNLGKTKEILIQPELLLMQMAKYLEKKEYNIELDNEEYLPREELKYLAKQLTKTENIEYVEDLGIYLFAIESYKDHDKKIKKAIFPDIIIHHRGIKENKIVIEAKKSNNKNKQSRIFDLIKLITLTTSSEFEYQHGIFIDIPVKEEFSSNCKFKKENTLFPKVFKYKYYN